LADLPDWTTHEQIRGTDVQVATDIQGAWVMVPVDIQGQTQDVKINIAAQDIVELAVNIVAQTIENLLISVNAQNVAVKSQGEWAPQFTQHKVFVNGQPNQTFAGYVDLSYIVPEGKALYITNVSFSVQASAAADADKLHHADLTIIGADSYILYLGGEGGGAVSLATPLRIAATKTMLITLQCWSNHACDLIFSVGGYEL